MITNSQNKNQELINSVLETLHQGETLLTEITDEAYTRKVPLAFNASIGGHYRHCLDHFRSLLDSTPDGDLNYDHRERGTLVENDRFAALNATRELRERYERDLQNQLRHQWLANRAVHRRARNHVFGRPRRASLRAHRRNGRNYGTANASGLRCRPVNSQASGRNRQNHRLS